MGGQRGVSLIEIALVLAVGGLILPPLAGILYQLRWIPFQQAHQLSIDHSMRQIASWVSEDSRMAQSFAPGSDPEYGTFGWTDYTESPAVSYSARYYWDDGALVRDFDDGAGTTTTRIATNVREYSDVTFRVAGGLVTVRATATRDAVRSAISRTADIRVQARPFGLASATPTPTRTPTRGCDTRRPVPRCPG